MNYDVSNVDNLYMPLSMETTDAWVLPQAGNRTGWVTGSHPDVYGWTGSIDNTEYLQTHLRQFTADSNALLGQYFGGKGWPLYNIPNPTNDPNAPVKIPSGANIFAQSPLKGTPSSYIGTDWKSVKFMLSSGGSEPKWCALGWAGTVTDPVGADVIHLNLSDPDYADKFAFIQAGDSVVGFPATGEPNPIQDGTTVLEVLDSAAGTVKLSKPLVNPSTASAFQFIRPVHDYASEAMVRLWYSWAQYYLLHWKDGTPDVPTSPTSITASARQNSATMTFNEAQPNLVKGMAVTGPGLDDAQTEVGIHQGNAIILDIASDKKSITLSQLPNVTSTNASFTFHPPPVLLWTLTASGDPSYPLFGDKFVFTDELAWHDPYEFSQQVYLIMAAINQIGHPNNDSLCKYMEDIIGANMGFIFTDAAKKTDDGQMLIAMIRDKIKSVLRGVTDFTKYADTVDDAGNHTVWYPAPSEAHGGQPFNVYNLDPFVWFVHVRLGFSGYGFSVDDDTGDIGAGGGSQLQLSVTLSGGLTNTNPWAVQAPFGPVKNVTLSYSGPASATNGDTLYNAIDRISDTTAGTHHLSEGTIVVIDQVNSDPAANGTFKIGNVAKTTFDLFDAARGTVSVAPTGTYTSGGRWAYPLHPYIDSGADLSKVFYRVMGDDALGTFLGTFVSVNGVDRNKTTGEKFRVWQLGKQDTGRLLLSADLTDANGNPLPAGDYTFTFFGVAEASPTPPTPTPTPTSNPSVIAQAQKDIRTLKQLIKKTKRTKTGPAKTQALSELRFAQRVANTVSANSTNTVLDSLLTRTMKATKIKNDKKRGKQFKQLAKQFKRLN